MTTQQQLEAAVTATKSAFAALESEYKAVIAERQAFIDGPHAADYDAETDPVSVRLKNRCHWLCQASDSAFAAGIAAHDALGGFLSASAGRAFATDADEGME